MSLTSRRKSPTQKATYTAIMTKLRRRRNPVTTLAQLAREFGESVDYKSRVPKRFRDHVVATIGRYNYNIHLG